MKNYRIGNTITVKWTLKTEDGSPYALDAQSIELYATSPNHKTKIKDFTTSNNVLTWIFGGDDQKYLGPYTLTLVQNRGKVGMVTVDSCDAFCLVQWSCLSGGSDSPNVDTESINLESTVSLSQVGLSPEVQEAIDETITEYNVSARFPTDGIDGTNRYTLETAIAKIPDSLRTVGIKCSFLNDDGEPETWIWQGGGFSVTDSWMRIQVDIDSELNADSDNPVANRAVARAIQSLSTIAYRINPSEEIVFPRSKHLFFKRDGEFGYIYDDISCGSLYPIQIGPNIPLHYSGRISAMACILEYDENFNIVKIWNAESSPDLANEQGYILSLDFTTTENTKYIDVCAISEPLSLTYTGEGELTYYLGIRDKKTDISNLEKSISSIQKDVSEINSNGLFKDKIDISRYQAGQVSVQDDIISIQPSASMSYAKIDVTQIPYIETSSNIQLNTVSFYITDSENRIIKRTHSNGNFSEGSKLFMPENSTWLYISREVPAEDIYLPPVEYTKSIYSQWAGISYDKTRFTGDNFNGSEFQMISQAGQSWAVSFADTVASCAIYVNEGDIISASGVIGLNNARAFVVLDVNNKVTRFADSGQALSDYKLTIQKDEKIVLFQTNVNALNDITIDIQRNRYRQDNNIVRVLSISNSYGCDALGYAPEVLKSMGITNYEFGIAYHARASINDHYNNRAQAFYTYYYTEEGVWKQSTGKSLNDILNAAAWDYIVFQHGSGDSGKIATYENLQALIQYCLDNNNQQHEIKIAFNMTQPYAEGYSGLSGYGSQETMYLDIINAMKWMKNTMGLKIIPTGIAVQIARTTSLNSYGKYGSQLTSDGTHLDDGIGRLLASYVWITSLLGIEVWSSEYYPQYPLDMTIPDGPRQDFVNVTEEMAFIAKECASRAIAIADDVFSGIALNWYMPDLIYAVKGVETSIYLADITNLNDNAPEYTISAKPDFGKIDGNRFYFTPTEVGEEEITFNMWRGENKISQHKLRIAVIDNVINVAKLIVCIGDSITENKNMAYYIQTGLESVLTEGSLQPTFVGTQGGVSGMAGKPTKHEGWYGRTYSWLATSNESPLVNPDTGKIDIAHYKTTLSIEGEIHAVSLAAGFNDCASMDSALSGFQAMQSIIAAFKEAYSDTKFVVQLVTYPAKGNVLQPEGEERQEKKNYLSYFRRLCLDAYGNNQDPNIIIGNMGICYDRWYAYPRQKQKPSQFYENDLIEVVTDRVHPTEEGTNEMAYGLIPGIVKILQ